MNIINIETQIAKWELTEGKFTPPIKEGERLSFLIGRDIDKIKHCTISADIFITAENTNFILDLTITSNVEFTNLIAITSKDIYELYKAARVKWIFEILQKGKQAGFLKPMIIINVEGQSYSSLKPLIDLAISRSLDQNN